MIMAQMFLRCSFLFQLYNVNVSHIVKAGHIRINGFSLLLCPIIDIKNELQIWIARL